jgi:hypothetical protein
VLIDSAEPKRGTGKSRKEADLKILSSSQHVIMKAFKFYEEHGVKASTVDHWTKSPQKGYYAGTYCRRSHRAI